MRWRYGAMGRLTLVDRRFKSISVVRCWALISVCAVRVVSRSVVKNSYLNVQQRPHGFGARARDHALTLQSEPWPLALITLFMATGDSVR
jgi:hypothetical protein